MLEGAQIYFPTVFITAENISQEVLESKKVGLRTDDIFWATGSTL